MCVERSSDLQAESVVHDRSAGMDGERHWFEEEIKEKSGGQRRYITIKKAEVEGFRRPSYAAARTGDALEALLGRVVVAGRQLGDVGDQGGQDEGDVAAMAQSHDQGQSHGEGQL